MVTRKYQWTSQQCAVAVIVLTGFVMFACLALAFGLPFEAPHECSDGLDGIGRLLARNP